MPRSIWNGLISFGMVSIPVKLFTATDSKDISFHLLHRECNSRLKQLRWCPVCEREVEWGETVRGYEYAKEQHVIMTDEDFDKLPLPSKRTIELSAFVKAEEIDPVYYEKSYYLDPDEIRVERGTEVPEVQVSDRELEMASTLIDLLADSFEPEKYQDEYRRALMEIIEAKLQGEEFVEAPAAAPAKVTDLMAALKASVAAAKKRRGEEAEEEPRRGRRAAAG